MDEWAHIKAHHCVILKHWKKNRIIFRLPEIKKERERSHKIGNWMFSEFSTAMLKAGGHWSNSFQILKENYFQPRILYPAKLYGGLRFSGKNDLKKNLPDG